MCLTIGGQYFSSTGATQWRRAEQLFARGSRPNCSSAAKVSARTALQKNTVIAPANKPSRLGFRKLQQEKRGIEYSLGRLWINITAVKIEPLESFSIRRIVALWTHKLICCRWCLEIWKHSRLYARIGSQRQRNCWFSSPSSCSKSPD